MRLSPILLHCVTLGLASIAASTSQAAGKRPNIIIIQTDDQGYDDIAFHQPAGSSLKTPTFDSLAQRSVRFDNFYVAPLCSPSRAMVLTGRHHLRTGVWGVHAGQDFLALDETTIAQPLKAAGYRTGFVGKWHSGKTAGYFPWDRGFDDATMAKLYVYRDNPLLHNGIPERTEGWTEERLADRAIKFIEDNSPGEPFFLYYCPLTCHAGVASPEQGESADRGAQSNAGFHAPEEYVQPYLAQGLGGELAKLYGMITFLDTQLARVFATLEKRGLTEDTLIIVLGDNGPTPQTLSPAEWEQRNPSHMRGAKTRVDENGVRSFLFISQGKRFAPHLVSDLAVATDLFPTVLAIAGVPSPDHNKPLDGFSLKPLLENSEWAHRDRLWCQIELLNSSKLDVNSLPAASADGTTLRPQPLLTLGDPSNKISNVFAVRQGSLKLSKGSLYDLASPGGHREEPAIEDPAAKASLEAAFSSWWQGVADKPNSFQKPTLLLSGPLAASAPDFATRTTFYAHQTVRTQGKALRVDNHAVFGFSNVGDQLSFRVANPDAGNYAAVLRFRGNIPEGKLTVAAYISAADGNGVAAKVQAASDGSNEIRIPNIALPVATASAPIVLALEVVASEFTPEKPSAFTELRILPNP